MIKIYNFLFIKSNSTRKYIEIQSIMKENKPPLFVKLFLPESQDIDKKQLISAWGQPHPKQFQIIDNPSIINRIANKLNQNRRPYSSVKVNTQPDQIYRNKKPKYVVKKTKKLTDRIKYGKLNQQVNCLSDFIENQVTQINTSQIFQYKQKMLTIFLQTFFEQLQKQCHEKASFIRQIWNQAINLFDRIFEKQNQNSLNYEKSSLKQIINLHKAYQQMIDKFKIQKQQIIAQRQRHKQLIKSLVRNLRERKKQIKVYQGGIHQYNHKINDLTAQFTQLKKQHLQILMYGHRGNMTRQQAQNMLMTILKPVDQDQQDLREGVSIKYIAPKLQQGKSDKYLTLLTENQIQDDHESEFDNGQNLYDKDIKQILQPLNYQLKNNFVPKRIKFRKHKKSNDVKVQTQCQNPNRPKQSDSVQCNYFTRMQQFLIKNKYCQTQIKKQIKINASFQTDITGDLSFIAIKRQKLQIYSNVLQQNLYNINARIDLKSTKTINTNIFIKSQLQLNKTFKYQDQDDDQKQDDSQKQDQWKINLKNNIQQIIPNKKQKNLLKNKENLIEKKKQKKPLVRKSIRTPKIKQSKQQQSIQPATKINIKTQNFIKLNKARISGQNKTILTQYYFNYYKNILPSCSNQYKLSCLLRQYFNQNSQEIGALQNLRGSVDSLQKDYDNIIFQNKKWSNKILKLIYTIKTSPQQEYIDLSFYYNSRIKKNKRMDSQNKEYIQKIKQYVQNSQINSIQKKPQKIHVQTKIQTFTLKKTYKIIQEVFQVCIKIRQQKNILNINIINILQKLFNPDLSKLQKQTIIEKSQLITNNSQNLSSYKTTQFLKYLIKNVNQNYLFKNFLFLCGINYKLTQDKHAQVGIVNINRNTNIGQKQDRKSNQIDKKSYQNDKRNQQNDRKSNESDKKSLQKPILFDIMVKNQLTQKHKKITQKQQYGTLIYSSQIIFYFQMLKSLNCYSNLTNDISNSYTTLQSLHNNFQKLSKFYKDQKLIHNIKNVIQQSLKHSTLNSSKLNIFKCLQIFLQKIRQRKIQTIRSYWQLYQFAQNKNKNFANQLLITQILTIVKASPQNQLKIIEKYLKSFDKNANIEDLSTFFIIQGFPQLQLVQQAIIKSKNQIQYMNKPLARPLQNIILQYISQKAHKQNNSKLIKDISLKNQTFNFQETLKRQMQQSIGSYLNDISITCTFVISQTEVNKLNQSSPSH